MIADEIIPILEGLDEYNMTEVSFQITACNLSAVLIGRDKKPMIVNLKSF